MTKFFPERHVVAQVASRHTYNDARDKLTEGVPEKPAVEHVDWRLEGEYPIHNPFEV